MTHVVTERYLHVPCLYRPTSAYEHENTPRAGVDFSRRESRLQCRDAFVSRRGLSVFYLTFSVFSFVPIAAM